MSVVFRTFDPPSPLQPASLSSPHTKGGGVHTRRAVRGGGSIFRKTPDIGWPLTEYSLCAYNIYIIGAQACLPAAKLALEDVNKREDILRGYHLNLAAKDDMVTFSPHELFVAKSTD